MRVMLVEDDAMIGEAIGHALKDASYAVDWVRDGSAAVTSIGTQNYGIVLLDLGLPKKDGIEVLRHIRARDNPVPVLIITARDALEDRIGGLDAGASGQEAASVRFAASTIRPTGGRYFISSRNSGMWVS